MEVLNNIIINIIMNNVAMRKFLYFLFIFLLFLMLPVFLRIAELADDELQLKKEIDEALDEIYKVNR